MSSTQNTLASIERERVSPPSVKTPDRFRQAVQESIRLAALQAAAAVAMQYQLVAKSLGEVSESVGRLVAYLSTDRRELLEEVRRLREDTTARAICTPFLFDLCQLAKESWTARVELEQRPASKTRDDALDRFENIYGSAIEALARYGLREFTVNVGEKIDPGRCEPKRVHRPTTNPQLVNVIAETVSPGFERGDEVVARATVVVFGPETCNPKEYLP